MNTRSNGACLARPARQGVDGAADDGCRRLATAGALEVGAGDVGVLRLEFERHDATVVGACRGRARSCCSRRACRFRESRAPDMRASRCSSLPDSGETSIAGRPAAMESATAPASVVVVDEGRREVLCRAVASSRGGVCHAASLIGPTSMRQCLAYSRVAHRDEVRFPLPKAATVSRERGDDGVMTRRHATLPTPLGELIVVADGDALVGIYFRDTGIRPPSDPSASRSTRTTTSSSRGSARQLTEYLNGTRTTFDLPLAPTGDEFQQAVWAMLRDIRFGETTTYGELAARLGDRNLARRVGNAVGRNPLSIVVPCHRVVGADGSLTGYAGGLERKHFLLEHEGAAVVAHGCSESDAPAGSTGREHPCNRRRLLLDARIAASRDRRQSSQSWDRSSRARRARPRRLGRGHRPVSVHPVMRSRERRHGVIHRCRSSVAPFVDVDRWCGLSPRRSRRRSRRSGSPRVRGRCRPG